MLSFAAAAVTPICPVSVLVQSLAGIPPICAFFEPAQIDYGADLEDQRSVLLDSERLRNPDCIFALPAGLGDMLIGSTAPLIAGKLSGRSGSKIPIWWQVLGMLDLVMAWSLAAPPDSSCGQDPGWGAMTVLPLSLVPAFVVPLLFIFHIICIAQARRESGRRNSGFENEFSTPAMKISSKG